MKNAELLLLPSHAALRFLPEGPYPRDADSFSWVAIQHGADKQFGSLNVYNFSRKENTTYPLPGRPGFGFATDKGNFVVGCDRTVGIFSPHDSSFRPFLEGIDSHVSGTVINDGLTWNGNLIFGTKDLEFKTKKAGLYFWRGADKKLFQLRDDQVCSNGKCIVSEGEGWIELLDIDSPTRCVMRYKIDLEAGKIVSESIAVDLRQDEAVPDGMTLSLDGKSVIISLYNPNPAEFGRTIQVNLSSGQAEYEWRTPKSPQATCPQWFVFQDELLLIITTAVEHMPSNRQLESNQAGALFAVPFGKIHDRASYDKLTQPFLE